MKPHFHLRRSTGNRFYQTADAESDQESPLGSTAPRLTQAEVADTKLKVALLRARSVMFRSPAWPVEFEGMDTY